MKLGGAKWVSLLHIQDDQLKQFGEKTYTNVLLRLSLGNKDFHLFEMKKALLDKCRKAEGRKATWVIFFGVAV